MFRDDTCTNCELKTYFDVTYADANGKWSKNNIDATNVVVTATDTAGMTSRESGAKIEFKNFTTKDATCGKNNGSITGINITSGTWWQWEDDKGNIVGHDSVLKNVGPGDYRLVVGIGFHSCTLRTDLYHINNVTLPASLNPTINPASCGRSNGSIAVDYDNYTYDGKWFNEANQLVATGRYLQNALPGNYTFQLSILKDASCNLNFGPYTIPNQSGPTLDLSKMQINAATCEKNNGSIKGLNVNNTAPGVVFVQWIDSSDKVVGSALNLLDVYPGKYKMKLKDASACDTIVTAYFIIPSNGSITIDSSSMIIHPAKCSGEGGAINNLVAKGADGFQWQDISTGATAGTNVNVFNLPAGNYQLTVSNGYGCTKVITVTIPQASFKSIGVSSFTSVPASCQLANGSLQPQAFTTDTSTYSFWWVDSTTNQVISNYTKVQGIYGGTYLLYAKDNNSCEKMIYKTVVETAPMPSFNYSNMKVSPDNCLSGKGSITGITINNLPNGTTNYAWLNSTNYPIGNTVGITNLSMGDYLLKVKDALSCTIVSNTIAVGNINIALPSPQYDDQVILKNTAATLSVKNKQPGSYQLYEDIQTSPVQSNTTGIFTTEVLSSDKVYYVRYTSGVCESAFVPVHVTVVDKVAVYVPTGFSPNGDGKNEVLKPVIFGPVKLKYFSIYNRWGQQIFYTTQVNKGWDGKLNGQPADPGIYIWAVSSSNGLTGESISQKGTVMLIR